MHLSFINFSMYLTPCGDSYPKLPDMLTVHLATCLSYIKKKKRKSLLQSTDVLSNTLLLLILWPHIVCMHANVCLCKCRYRLPGSTGSPDVKWHVNRPAPLVTGWGRKKQTNKNRHTLYKKLRHHHRSRWLFIHPPSSIYCYNIPKLLFFYHVPLFFYLKMSNLENLSGETLRHECSRMTSWAQERLACHIEWEEMPSWLFLQSSLSGSGQFTCLSVRFPYHYTFLNCLAWPISSNANVVFY